MSLSLQVPGSDSSALITKIPSRSATPEQEFIPLEGSQFINSILKEILMQIMWE